MAVAYDSTGTTGVANASHTGTTAYTYTHTVSSSASVTVILGITIVGGGSQPWSYYAPTAVTFGGAPMKLLGYQGNNRVVNATGFVALYGYTASGINGAKTVSITCPITGYWNANSVAYTGVSGISGTYNNWGSSTDPTTGAITSATNHMVTSILGTYHVAPSAYSQTERFVGYNGTLYESGDIQDAAGAATVTTGLTCVTAAWGALAVDLSTAATVQYDATGGGDTSASTRNTISWSHTATAGAYVVVAVTIYGNYVVSASYPTYGATVMTSIGSMNLGNNATYGVVHLFGLANAPGGAQTVTVNISGTTYVVGNSVSYLNATSADTAQTAYGVDSAATKAATCSAGQMIVEATGSYNAGSGVDTALLGGANRYNAGARANLNINDASASTTFSATCPGSNRAWSIVAVPLYIAAGAGPQDIDGSLAVTATLSGTGRIVNQSIGGSLAVTATLSGTGRIVNQSITGSLAVTATVSGATEYGQPIAGTTLAETATLSGAAQVTNQSIGGSLAVTATGSGAATYGQPATGSLAVTADLSGAATLVRANADQNIDGSLDVTVTLAGEGSRAAGMLITGDLPITVTATGAAQLTNQGAAGSLPVTADSTGAAAYGQPITGSLPVTTTDSGAAQYNQPITGTLGVTADLTGEATQAAGLTVTGALAVTATTSGAAQLTNQSCGGALAVTATTAGDATTAAGTTAQDIDGSLAVTATTTGAGRHGAPLGGSLAVTVTPSGAAAYGQHTGGALAVIIDLSGATELGTGRGGALAVAATLTGALRYDAQIGGALAVIATPLGAAISVTGQVGQLAVTVLLVGQIQIGPVPAERSWTVPADDRAFTIPADDRAYAVAADNRTYTIPADDRAHTIPADDRAWLIPADNREHTL